MPRVADRRIKIELLRAAEAVFSERGLAGARVEDITGRAGVSKGAFYLHFKSKEDCFQQIVEGFVARLASTTEPPDDIFEGLPATAGELLERVREHHVSILEFCWQNRSLLRMMLAGGGGTPYAYLIDEFAVRVASRSKRLLARGIAAGLYRTDLDPELASAVLSGGYERLVRELIQQDKRPDLVAWCTQVQRIFQDGILSSEARQQRDRRVSNEALAVEPV
ncbi:TetR/AcrR family transcriptional regulator [Chondromyces crocatus]|uniref:AcrR family transcriptional regulator n=1 Tax=Chondromyces crocatus TaxID=52 RepID=A0A0K1ENR3_CHOCO|nr:TetR/AcrR family transcriptional regulator [Chondromyces crocatus]AKT42253.1 AcrR family transcriptional regulator [Chondromyces crocatus]